MYYNLRDFLVKLGVEHWFNYGLVNGYGARLVNVCGFQVEGIYIVYALGWGLGLGGHWLISLCKLFEKFYGVLDRQINFNVDQVVISWTCIYTLFVVVSSWAVVGAKFIVLIFFRAIAH